MNTKDAKCTKDTKDTKDTRIRLGMRSVPSRVGLRPGPTFVPFVPFGPFVAFVFFVLGGASAFAQT